MFRGHANMGGFCGIDIFIEFKREMDEEIRVCPEGMRAFLEKFRMGFCATTGNEHLLYVGDGLEGIELVWPSKGEKIIFESEVIGF